MCKIHTNFALVTLKLHKLSILTEKTPEEVIRSITCENGTYAKESCLERKCKECMDKKVKFLEYNETDTATLYQWRDKKVEFDLKGEKKTVKNLAEEISVNVKTL